MGNEKPEANTKHTKDDVGYLSSELLLPEDLLNRYVIVRYERQVYPGVVLDTDEAEVYIRCMHRVGRSADSYAFYWPKAVKDECWYKMEDVLAVIPEPQLVNRKYHVAESVWNFVSGCL